MSIVDVGVRAVVQNLSGYIGASAQIEAANARINQSTESVAASSKKFGASFQESSLLAGKALLAVEAGAAALAAAFVGAAVRAAQFEQAMAGIKAVSGASASEMQRLSDAALTAGKQFGFTATETASAEEALIKAGVSITDVLGGALPAALTLAAAGEIDVKDAAEIAANAINQFSLKGSDMAHVADTIAGAANASAIDVKDFQLSLQQAGAVAATAGESFDSTAQAIAVMGSAGIKSSDAGTSLKTMLMNLQPQSKNAAQLMELLGLMTKSGANAFFDAEGKVKSFRDIAEVLKTSLGGLTSQQQLATLSIIFGSDAARGAAIFAREGAAGFDEMAASMGKVSAADVAGQRLNSLEGDLSKLKVALDNVAITAGTQTTPELRSATQALTDLVNVSEPAAVAVGSTLASALLSGAQAATIFAVKAGDLVNILGKIGSVLPVISGLMSIPKALEGATSALNFFGGGDTGFDFNAEAAKIREVGTVKLQDFSSLQSSVDDYSQSLLASAKATDTVSAADARLRAQLDALLKAQRDGTGRAKEAQTGLQQLSLSTAELRHAMELLKFPEEDVRSVLLKLGANAAEADPVIFGMSVTMRQLAEAFDRAGLSGQKLAAQVNAIQEAVKAKEEADKAAKKAEEEKAKQDALNSESAGRLQGAIESANFSLDEQRRILGALGVDLLDIGPKIDGVGATAARLTADFERAGLSADEAAAAVKRLSAAADAAKASTAAVTSIESVSVRDTLGNIRGRAPVNASASAAEFTQAAAGLSALKAGGQDLAVALDVINGHLGALATRAAELSGDDKASAGALLDKLAKLRAGFEAGTISLEDYQKALQDAASDVGKLGGAIDDLDKANAKFAEDAQKAIAADILASATERATSALQEQRDELNYNLGPAWTRVGQTMAQAMEQFQKTIDTARQKVDELLAVTAIVNAQVAQDLDSGQRAREAAGKFQAGLKPGEASTDIAAALQDALAGGGRADNTFQTIFFGMVTAALEAAGIHVAPRIGQGLSSAIADALGVPSFASGGMVGGPFGAPRLIMAHGGEQIMPGRPDLVLLPPTTSQGGRVDRSVTYNLTANYSRPETPQSIRYELETLRMLAGS